MYLLRILTTLRGINRVLVYIYSSILTPHIYIPVVFFYQVPYLLKLETLPLKLFSPSTFLVTLL